MPTVRTSPGLSSLSLTVLLAVATASASCFEIEPRKPPPAPGSIAGQVVVSSASGLSTRSDGDAVRQARVDVTLAGARPAEPSTLAMPAPEARRRRDRPPEKKSRTPLEWKAGDLLVLFEDKAYDENTLAPALGRMLKDAGLSHVTADVVRCTARRYCKVELRDESRALLDAEETKNAAERLHKHRAPGVKVVARNMKKYGFRVPNDPLVGFQWHYEAIGMPAAWDIANGDPNLVVAVVDSGIVQAHPDINDRLARDPLNNTVVGVDLVSDDVDGDDIPGRDTDPEDPGDEALGGESTFHGSHVAGIIGAESDNGEGVAGITFEGNILPVRVLGLGLAGFDDDIMDGIYWALGEPNVPGVPQNVRPARIVNLSLGGPSDASSQEFWELNFAQIFQDPAYNNPIFIAAAGNSDEDAGNITPANLPAMITVGAADIRGIRARYSNYGAGVDVMAPGGDVGTDLDSDGNDDQILSLVANDYGYRNGTSMAAPHVTGVAALLIATKPELTQAQVQELIRLSANPNGRCSEGCGTGLLDAVGALLLAGGEIQLEPLLTTDVTQLFVREGLQSAELRVLNLGNAPFSFETTIEGPQEDLFSVTPASGTLAEATGGIEQASATLTVTLDRQGFEAGSANLRIVTTDVTPAQEVVVNLGFNDDPNRVPRQVEVVEVSAFKKDAEGNLDRVAAALATRENGFAFEIGGLRPGEYFVFAVGDDNRDGVFSADVESFGGYPKADEPGPIVVLEGKRTEGIDMTIDPAFITDIVGGVGAPCNDRNDCTFAPDADCIDTFEGGYCSRICDDGDCGANGACETLECDQGVPCNVCLVRCSNDNQCRFAESYVCDLGACVPSGFAVGG